MKRCAALLLTLVFMFAACADGADSGISPAAFLSAEPVLLSEGGTASGFVRTNGNISLASSDDSVASVATESSGGAYQSYRITAHSAGNCMVILTENGEQRGTLSVTVTGSAPDSSGAGTAEILANDDIAAPPSADTKIAAQSSPAISETSPSPVVETGTSVVETDAPTVETDAPSAETSVPSVETNAPTIETNAPETTHTSKPEVTEPVATEPVSPPPPVSGGEGITLIALTGTVGRNETASVSVRVSPFASCSITVTYSSGPSSAAGLETKTADENGNVSWNWKVGSRTKPGSYPIRIATSDASAEYRFEVIA